MPWPRSSSITVRVLAVSERLVLQRLDNRAIRGTDDAVRAEELFHAVRRPTGHAGDGEQRRKERLGHAEHLVDKARVQVDVGADGLGHAVVAHDLGCQALDALDERELIAQVLLGGKRARVTAADLGARVAERIDGVAIP